jgi:eukaryotic-like serine/threonine-protein kinase
MALRAGTKLGPYEVQSSIGAGGMGEVYRARDGRLGRDVAIKVLPASFSADQDRLQRFALECRATAVKSSLRPRGGAKHSRHSFQR